MTDKPYSPYMPLYTADSVPIVVHDVNLFNIMLKQYFFEGNLNITNTIISNKEEMQNTLIKLRLSRNGEVANVNELLNELYPDDRSRTYKLVISSNNLIIKEI